MKKKLSKLKKEKKESRVYEPLIHVDVQERLKEIFHNKPCRRCGAPACRFRQSHGESVDKFYCESCYLHVDAGARNEEFEERLATLPDEEDIEFDLEWDEWNDGAEPLYYETPMSTEMLKFYGFKDDVPLNEEEEDLERHDFYDFYDFIISEWFTSKGELIQGDGEEYEEPYPFGQTESTFAAPPQRKRKMQVKSRKKRRKKIISKILEINGQRFPWVVYDEKTTRVQ